MYTFKVTIRKNLRSPKYRTILGMNTLANGFRVDVPYASVAAFRPNSGRETIRSKKSGLRAIYENNRSGVTRVYHLV
jgi:hypothetical protein